MNVSFFEEPKHKPSILTSRLSVDGRRLRDFIDISGKLVENTLIIIACLIICYSPLGEWRLSTLAIVISPLVLCIAYLQFVIASNIHERIDSALTKESGIITDYLMNIHTVHSYGLEETLLSSIDRDMSEVDKLTKSRAFRTALGQGLTQFFPTIFVIVIMSVGTSMMNQNLITYLQLFIVYMSVYSSASYLGTNLASTPSVRLAQRSAKNIVATLHMTSEDDNAKKINTKGQNGDITFKDVSFVYPTRPEVPILKSVSFTIPQGKSVAFVGPSGCGKSTIISLIQRLYKPVTGTIELAGVDVETLSLDWYRAQLGAVNQEPVLFSGTIRENLQLGVNKELTEEELEEACKQALCLDFINEMPDRFETDLGAVGKAVSGGQKQRLALARAILRTPAILLLDEATSALDSENQEKFLTALSSWRTMHPCTVITVAHRLSTIAASDIIFVINEGEIVGSGTHEKLLSSCSFYANLVHRQLEGSY